MSPRVSAIWASLKSMPSNRGNKLLSSDMSFNRQGS